MSESIRNSEHYHGEIAANFAVNSGENFGNCDQSPCSHW